MANRHQNHRVVAREPKVHALLEARSFSLTHLNVGNDIVTHEELL